jgi:hypothetical protein
VKPESCQATTRTGTRCAAQAVDGVHCPWHATSPEWVAKRSQWSAEGGRKRSNAERARKSLPDAALTPTQLACVLSKALGDVLGGSLSPGPANAAAALARTLVSISEAVEFETRLTALEAALSERRTA